MRTWLRRNSNDRSAPQGIEKAQTQKMALQGKTPMGSSGNHLVMPIQSSVDLIPRPSVA
jgi:hypothetical protein